MKLVIITALSLVSSVAMADGFRCQGGDFRVKLYNETQPERGTRNPAVLIVSERSIGTVAKLDGADIEKTNKVGSVVYEGKANSKRDGRFVYVKFQVLKRAEVEGVYAGQHLARLTLNQNGYSRLQTLACDRYLKGERE